MLGKKKIYDINYLLNEDIKDTKPNLEKLEKVSPYLAKDEALVYSLFSTQDIPQKVKEYYKNNAFKAFEDYNKKYSHLLEIMETKDYS
jgi:hypothetical protein